MKQMLKIEIERAFEGTAFKLALAIGCLISLVQFFNVGVRHAINPLEFYWYNWLHFPYTVIDTWLGANTDVYYEVFNRVVPLLVAIPYAASYYTDKRSGIINNYYVRTKRINYLVAKLAAVFLTGGAIVVFPLFINFVSTSAIVPTFLWKTSSFEIGAGAMWSSIFYKNMYVYYLLYFILEFVCAGLLATISLVVSLWMNNTFVVLLFPTILCEFMNVASTWSSINAIHGLAPRRLFNMAQLTPNYWQSYVIFIVVIVVFDVVIYLWRGVKRDAI